MPCRECNELFASIQKENIGLDQQRLGMLLNERQTIGGRS